MSLPAPIDLRITRLVTALSNRLEKGPLGGSSISDRRLPTNGEYAALRARKAGLLASLAPATDAAIRSCVGAVLVGHHARGSAEQAAAQLAVFADVLTDLPVWAIQSGCGALIRRNVAWPPNSGQVRAACLAACEPARDELAGIERILNADVYHEPTSDERAATKVGFEQLLADLKLREQPDPLRPKEQRPSTRQEALDWLDRERPNPHCPPFGPSLRASLGLPETQSNDEKAA